MKVWYSDNLKSVDQNTNLLSNVYLSRKSTNSQILPTPLKWLCYGMNENRSRLILV